jgi:hypothetical protein
MKTVSILTSIAAVALFAAATTVSARDPLLSPKAKELRINRISGVTEERIDRTAPMVPGKLFGRQTGAAENEGSGKMACCNADKAGQTGMSCGMKPKAKTGGMSCGG